jgi:mono/diheme cytochrome c family protein
MGRLSLGGNDGGNKEDPVKRPANIGILSAAFALAIAATASVSFTVTANGQAPAIGQAPPPAIGQAPAVGQAPSSAASSAAPAAPQPGDMPVSFSLDQATRGQVTFKRVCVDCHGDDLRGGLNGGPPLRGNAFDEVFANGAPASGLFTFISTAMPPDSPGQFSPAEYAELTAYILQQNGYQPGAPLPTDTDALDHLIIQK